MCNISDSVAIGLGIGLSLFLPFIGIAGLAMSLAFLEKAKKR